MPPAIDVTTEDRRQRYLDWLYACSGRTNGLYTGLYQQRLHDLVERDMRFAIYTGESARMAENKPPD